MSSTKFKWSSVMFSSDSKIPVVHLLTPSEDTEPGTGIHGVLTFDSWEEAEELVNTIQGAITQHKVEERKIHGPDPREEKALSLINEIGNIVDRLRETYLQMCDPESYEDVEQVEELLTLEAKAGALQNELLSYSSDLDTTSLKEATASLAPKMRLFVEAQSKARDVLTQKRSELSDKQSELNQRSESLHRRASELDEKMNRLDERIDNLTAVRSPKKPGPSA